MLTYYINALCINFQHFYMSWFYISFGMLYIVNYLFESVNCFISTNKNSDIIKSAKIMLLNII